MKFTHHGYYDHHRPYRDKIIEINQKLGQTKFSKDQEFWTLGGPEHFEFKDLSKYLHFGRGSYHTVDRYEMAKVKGLSKCGGIVAHPQYEFGQIFEIWRSPFVISYDSQEVLTPPLNGGRDNQLGRFGKFLRLCRLGLAASKAKSLTVHSNWMVGYANMRSPAKKRDKVVICNSLERWIDLANDWFDNIEFFDSGIELMEGSQTPMIDIHFRIWR